MNPHIAMLGDQRNQNREMLSEFMNMKLTIENLNETLACDTKCKESRICN